MKASSSVALAASSALALASIAPAFAHETRILDAVPVPLQILLVVGWHAEPAWEDSYNAIDVILSTFDGTCPAPNANVNISQPISTGGTATANDPDKVSLKVDAIYLEKAAPPTGKFGSGAPAGIITSLTITNKDPLVELFGGPGTYNSWVRPTHLGDGTKGAYGFYIKGTVHAGPKSFSCPGGSPQTLAARDAAIDNYFVCGEGTLSLTGRSFQCIRPIQTFPGNRRDGYKPNRPFAHDGF